MTNVQRVALVLGGVALIVGLILLVSPVSAGSRECGSVLSEKTAPRTVSPFVAALTAGSCDEARSDRLGQVILVGLPGLGAVLYSVVRLPTAEGSGLPKVDRSRRHQWWPDPAGTEREDA